MMMMMMMMMMISHEMIRCRAIPLKPIARGHKTGYKKSVPMKEKQEITCAAVYPSMQGNGIYFNLLLCLDRSSTSQSIDKSVHHRMPGTWYISVTS